MAADAVAAVVVAAAAEDRVLKNEKILSGCGVGWRPQLAMHIERRKDLKFIEVLADNHFMETSRYPAIESLQKRGIKVALHAIGLSLCGSNLPDCAYIDSLNRLIDLYGAVCISEHLAFVRGGGLESGHLLPVKRDDATLKVVVENINFAAKRLNASLVLENIASYLTWPGETMDEAEFLSRILAETDCRLLLDISNLYANASNLGFSPEAFLDRLPLSKVAYMHIAGGEKRKGIYHDTHAHDMDEAVVELLETALLKGCTDAVLLERDDQFPDLSGFNKELDQIARALSARQLANV